MEVNTLTLNSPLFPAKLRDIPSAPKVLYHRGSGLEGLLKRLCVGIVGSRSVTVYGRQVTEQLARMLAGQGIVIISGLALGVDALAHRAALEAAGLTIAVLPGPVEKFYPAANAGLGEQILAKGGAVISEYPFGTFAGAKQNFIARNRLIAGLSDALLIPEAAEKSGSLHTARFALEQGKDVLAVPGNITSPTSVGTNNLIKAGATPVTSYEDVLHILGITKHEAPLREVKGRTAHEQAILDLLLQGTSDGEALLRNSRLSVTEFNQALTMLEISGKVRSLGLNHWAIR